MNIRELSNRLDSLVIFRAVLDDAVLARLRTALGALEAGALTDGENELHVAVRDPSDRGTQARGKQTLRCSPVSGWMMTKRLPTLHAVWLPTRTTSYFRAIVQRSQNMTNTIHY